MSDELGSLLNAVDNLCNILFVESKLGVLYMFAFMASAIALNSMARDCKPSRSDRRGADDVTYRDLVFGRAHFVVSGKKEERGVKDG